MIYNVIQLIILLGFYFMYTLGMSTNDFIYLLVIIPIGFICIIIANIITKLIIKREDKQYEDRV